MAFKQKWAGFENRMKAKREVNGKRKLKQQTPQKVDQLTVQRLSSDVSGKAQKFSRIGPREFVSYPYGDLTMEGIKKACEAHFLSQLKMHAECDVLAGEQGPSCSSLDQIPNLKLIHIRFVGTTVKSSLHSYTPTLASYSYVSPVLRDVRPAKRKPGQAEYVESSRSPVQAESVPILQHRGEKSNVNTSFPKSLSVTEMLNLGKVVRQKTTAAEIFKFNLEDMTWPSVSEKIELVVEQKPFAAGGFREVYKAKSPTKGYSGRSWVLKMYLPKTLKFIEELEQTVEDHTKKTVQMQSLARNIAETLYARVKAVCQDEFGQSFIYTDIFMAKLENGEFVAIEEYIDGKFTKYINNTGLVCGANASDVSKKAECLVHYSYEKSSKQLMLLDIQGSEYTLFDPEIASATLQVDKEYLFGVGNLTSHAIETFVENHVCNKFCTLVGLKPFPRSLPKEDED